MFKKLKTKFIILSMTALFVLLVVIVSGMNIINFHYFVQETDEIMDFVVENEMQFSGEGFPDNDKGKPPKDLDDKKRPTKTDLYEREKPNDIKEKINIRHSPEIAYQTRYFILTLDENDTIIDFDMSHIAAVTEEDAPEYSKEALSRKKNEGFVDNYRFRVVEDRTQKYILFYDCGLALNGFFDFLTISLVVSAVGYVVVSLVLVFFAGKIVGPIAEIYEKQRRFVADAGHEIRTPLTIINANVDIMKMEIGDDHESLKDIQNQTERLANLTNDLIYLSRIEEQGNILQKIEFLLSDLVVETVNSFNAPADLKNISINTNITPMLNMNGDVNSIEKLVNILMNNAIKYSPEDSTIDLSLTKEGKQIVLQIFNPSCYELNKESLPNVFDRFYRSDSSRNSQLGGHGIGLSMAKAIVSAHGGKIKATATEDNRFGVTIIFNA